jgi:hypothetical protein
MRPQSHAWKKYQDSARDFDAVIEHGKAVSKSLIGLKTPSTTASYGEQIFVSMLGQAMTLRRIAPDPHNASAEEFWDLPSMCAIARCVIEAHDSFMYIAASSVPEDQRDFRVFLWRLHDKTRRLKMLTAIQSSRPEVEEIRSEVHSLTESLSHELHFNAAKSEVRRKVNEGDPPAYHLSQRERCAAASLDFDYYNTVTMQLSQYVHTLPFALHQLFSFRAGSEETLGLMSLPLDYTLPFIARVTDQMRAQYPGRTPDPPSRTAKRLAVWNAIYERGVSAA